MPDQEILKLYGGKIRIRVCGILIRNQSVLLVNHKGLNKDHIFWNFPGGGLIENEEIDNCLKREFKEETGLAVEMDSFFYLNQHLQNPLHAIEFYFKVKAENFDFQLGDDPELNILTDIKWFKIEDLESIEENHCPVFLKSTSFISRLKESALNG